MQYLLKTSEMKACDIATSEYFKVPSICLMERAATAAFEEIKKHIEISDNILIVAGSGNNGGDALATARLLYLDGYNITAAFVGNAEHTANQTSLQLEILKKYKIPIIANAQDIHKIDFNSYSCIIDGIFGIGLNRDITENYRKIIEKINNSYKSKIFSVDIPSGINADNGKIMGCAVKADFTITFAFRKAGQFLYPGADYCGEIILKDIGITKHSLFENKPQIYTYSKEDLHNKLPKRINNSNKGTFGKITMFVGSKNMAGAAYLSAKAALCSGAGYVRIITSEENRQILQTLIPEAVLFTYSNIDDKNNFLALSEDVRRIIQSSNVVACGCGIGEDNFTVRLLEILLKYHEGQLVLDADALNILAKNNYLYKYIDKNTIITPHLGEMSRLTGKSIKEIKGNLQETSKNFAEEHAICCILKDARTFVSMPGFADYLNIHGCNGMSTAGSGDVLTGIISALLANGMSIKDAADCGVLIHSLAGEEAALKYSNTSMTAGNIIEEISTVFRTLID